MKVCIIAEGCYPYVVGGVSSWVHSLIQQFPNIEFIVTSIVANRSQRAKFAYKLPDNVSEVNEIYLMDDEFETGRRNKKAKLRLSTAEFEAIRGLVIGERVDWKTIFDMFQHRRFHLNDLLMSEDFLRVAEEVYELRYPSIVFSDFLWTLRSIYLPLGFALKHTPAKADLYHCVATGYSGIVGSVGKELYGSPLLISEHGIYTREREEEIIKAKWVTGVYKDFWIEQFKKMSMCAYDYADIVTSLFEDARSLQIELGCPKEKTRVTPNGVSVSDFENIPQKAPDDGMINIGAAIRVTPIKDVKTMIQAFYYAKQKNPKLKLWIMGSWDEDEEYARECFELVRSMNIPDVEFTGRINVKDYLGRMDMLLLTSISEGQPLSILEGFAAKRPHIATNVGNCRGLIYGEGDGLGAAGIVVPVMNIEKISRAICEMAEDLEKTKEMGEIGYRRVCAKYRIEDMKRVYTDTYKELAEKAGVKWPEKNVVIEKEEVGKSGGRHRHKAK